MEVVAHPGTPACQPPGPIRNQAAAQPTAAGATLRVVMSTEERRRREDDTLAVVIRRIAREYGWKRCCTSWLVLRVTGDIGGPVVRDPIDGRPLCPHCQRRTHVYDIAAARRTVAA